MIAVAIVNAAFAILDPQLWGASSTAVTSDSTHFRAWDQNLFTEWRSRYVDRGSGVYWNVERGSVVVRSQALSVSASEVAAMVEVAIRHGTSIRVEGNSVDTHGRPEIRFGIIPLPRIKRIDTVRLYRLYRSVAGQPDAYPHLAAALTRPIGWDVVAANQARKSG